MQRIYYLDVAAVLVLISLLASLIFRRMLRGKDNRAFVQYVTLLIPLTILDILRTADFSFTGIHDSVLRKEIFCALYNIVNIMNYTMYIYLVGKITGTFRIIMRKKILAALYFLPFIVETVLVISNFFNHRFFYYTSEDVGVVYHRGDLTWIFIVVGYYYVLFSMVHIIICYVKKRLSGVKYTALMVVFPINVITFQIQRMHPELLTQMFGFAITVLILTFFVINPVENLDMETGAKSYTAFRNSIGNVYMSGDDAFVVFGKLQNIASIRSALGYDMYMALLRQIADNFYSRLKGNIRVDLNLFYLKNGLFAYVIRGDYHIDEIEKEVQIILPKLRDLFVVDGIRLKLDFAICGVAIPREIGSERQLIRFSETFDYAIPINEYVRYSQVAPEKDFIVKNNIDRIISDAIKNNKFEMYYQPIYSTREKAFISAEALIRLKDEQLGFVSPALFIPAAEKSGSILQIGEFVIRDVCRFLSQGDAENCGIRFVEVNLSVIQCMQANMAEKIQDILKEYNIDPGRINFEITETASDYLADAVLRTMNDISVNGNGFSLDDYGSGYSNLGRVMSFPYRIIKLDKSLVDGLGDSRSYEVMRQTIILLKSLGAEIVVEGVEDEDKALWFAKMGCEYIQGYYYARPMPEREFIDFCRGKLGTL